MTKESRRSFIKAVGACSLVYSVPSVAEAKAPAHAGPDLSINIIERLSYVMFLGVCNGKKRSLACSKSSRMIKAMIEQEPVADMIMAAGRITVRHYL